MENLTNVGWHIRIIGKYYVNVSVHFIDIPVGWGIASVSLTYTPNVTISASNILWGWTDTDSNRTSSTATGI